ncbi:hypothetical protein GGF45_006151, partial [Coemansia sp. RSA 551]
MGEKMTLDETEKQKKLLAAKKKLKSFQAKRAAATQAGDGSEQEGSAGNVEEGTDKAQESSIVGGAAQAKEDESDVLSGELEQLKQQINTQREQLVAENKSVRDELAEAQKKLAEAEAENLREAQEAAQRADNDQAQLTERSQQIDALKEQMLQAAAAAKAAQESASDSHEQHLANREAELTELHTTEAAQLNDKI